MLRNCIQNRVHLLHFLCLLVRNLLRGLRHNWSFKSLWLFKSLSICFFLLWNKLLLFALDFKNSWILSFLFFMGFCLKQCITCGFCCCNLVHLLLFTGLKCSNLTLSLFGLKCLRISFYDDGFIWLAFFVCCPSGSWLGCWVKYSHLI